MEPVVLNGRYRLEHVVGHGAMGEVWRATDLALMRVVAVKQLRDPASHRPAGQLGNRLLREARLLAQLHHVNAVSVYDVGLEDNQPYVVMEYVNGESLAEVLHREGVIRAADAARLIADTGRGLAAAHRLGIVHRDIKPANIMITEGGAKLADFGIARQDQDSRLTDTGHTVGTFAFMAPEVLMGERASKASDIWSLGATFFAAVEGFAPYEDRNRPTSLPTMVMRAISEPVSTAPNAGTFSGVIEAMTRSNPQERPDAEAVVAELERLLAGQGGGADWAASKIRGRSRIRRRRFLVSLAAAALAASIGAAWAIMRPSAHPRSSGTTNSAAPIAHTPNAGTLYAVGLSGKLTIIAPNSTSTTTAATGQGTTAVAVAPAGTPNAGTVYTVNNNDNTVSALAPGTTTPVTIRVGLTPQDLAIAPAGTPNGGTVYVTNAGGIDSHGTVSIIAPNATTASGISVGNAPTALAIVPQGVPGQGTVYVADSGHTITSIAPDNRTVYTFDLGGASTATIGGASLAIGPAGTFGRGTLYVANYDEEKGVTVWMVTPGAGSIPTFKVGQGPVGIAIAPQGTPHAGTVYVASDNGTVTTFDPSTQQVHTVKVGDTPTAIALAPAGTPNAGTVYTANSNNTVSAIDPSTGSVRTILVGDGPQAIAIAPAGTPNAGTVYVANGRLEIPGSDTVSVIDPGSDAATTIEHTGFADALAIAP